MGNLLSTLADFLWGLPLIILVIGSGLFFTIGSGFFQFRKFGFIMKNTFGAMFKSDSNNEKGIVSPIQAVSIALASTIGVGNIAGVASAIATGGPGAVFWMWVAAFVGMMTKMVEVTLAVHYREVNPDGSAFGGPMYYIKKGLGIERGVKWWKLLAGIFIFGMFFVIFISLQSYTVAESFESTFGIPMIVTGTIYVVLTYLVLFGGIKRIAEMASKVVPLMTGFYLIGGLLIILMNIENVVPAFQLIFHAAFKPMAAVGGFGGAALSAVIKRGVSRSVYSNEAGFGTAPMAHATAKVKSPIDQGLWGTFEVFVDTIIVGTMTSLVILTTGVWSSGASGATLTLTAFESTLGYPGRVLLNVAIFIFAWTTSTGQWTYAESILRFMFGESEKNEQIVKVIRYIYPLSQYAMVLLAVTVGLPPKTMWLFADVMTALPTFINVLTCVALSGVFFKLLKDYESKLRNNSVEHLQEDVTE
ncbi:sodium:alanine symporter family protein [Clostridium sp. BSD9I1]|uniref:alanine/glycine:cation symporter family protein n=1 Tax=Clostridium sp. BSD9I1 TaxID=2003589 RepID=UPI001649335E|nr:sodium:alanine symporter family protein [Clostridium sp. BSD9I1]